MAKPPRILSKLSIKVMLTSRCGKSYHSLSAHIQISTIQSIPYWEILRRDSVNTSRLRPIILIFCTLSFYSRYLYSPHLSILWIFYGASILLIPVSCGYFMDFPENYKRKRMWLSIIPTNSNFLSSHRLISFLSSPHLTNESLKRTIC